jgi:hypothetical protein
MKNFELHAGIDLGVGWGKTCQPYRVPDTETSSQTDETQKKTTKKGEKP